jgi:hypothetical protein
MKRNLLTVFYPCRAKTVRQAAKALSMAFIVGLGFAGTATAQSGSWMIYEANELPDQFTASPFSPSGLNPVVSEAAPAMVATEQYVIVDPAKATNKLLVFKMDGNPHIQFMWSRSFEDTPSKPSAATVVVRARGLSGFTRAFEVDLDFGGSRETIHILNNGKFNYNQTKGDLTGATLPVDPLEWHTYRFTKTGTTVTLYIDENETFVARANTPTTSTNNHFRFGDSSPSTSNGGEIDYVLWDQTGAYSPSQKPLPSAVVLSARAEKTIKNGLTVYPNPTGGQVISVMHPAAPAGAELRVFSSTGLPMATLPATTQSTKTDLNLASLPAGVYSVVYSDSRQRLTSRLIKH